MRHRNTQGLFREDEHTPSDPAIIDGYTNPNQSLPSGRGKFRFISYEPNLSDSFETHNADDLLDRIFCVFGPVNIVRTYGDSWSVETATEKYGDICTVFGCLDIIKKCENICTKNGTSTEVPLKAAFYRYCGSSEASL